MDVTNGFSGFLGSVSTEIDNLVKSSANILRILLKQTPTTPKHLYKVSIVNSVGLFRLLSVLDNKSY